MSTSKITKSVVTRGNEILKVYSEDGVLHTSESLASFVPITFNNLKKGENNIFTFPKNCEWNYQVCIVTINWEADKTNLNKSIITYYRDFQISIGLQIIKNDKPIQNHFLNVNNGYQTDFKIFLRSDEKMKLDVTNNLISLTFWCKPCFIESEIALKKLPEDSPER